MAPEGTLTPATTNQRAPERTEDPPEAPRGPLLRGNAWILRRIALGFVTLALVSVLIFVATVALPGDPARTILGHSATPETIAQVEEELELDKPPVERYVTWASDVVTGDLGISLQTDRPVTELISDRIANSLVLVFLTAIVALPLGTVIGAVAAARRGSRFDEIVSLGTLLFASIPEFVIGLALIMLFATTVLNVLPAVSVLPSGLVSPGDMEALVLPVATLTLAVLPYVIRIVRASMIDLFASDYVEMARLKGLPDSVLVRRHVLRNALVPLIQVSALELAWMAGGIVVVEYLFQYPGLGSALTTAVAARDVPVIQALVLFLAAFYVVVNLVADILTVAVTPRLRGGSR